MISAQASASTRASAATVWGLWNDVAGSPAWDTDVAWSRLHGSFAAGTRGEFKLKRGPSLAFVIDEVTVERSYANVVRLPGLRVRFTHTLDQLSPTALRVTHGVELSGGLGWLVAPLLRRPLARAMAAAIDNLVQLAERTG
jgi:hypothetical protein